MLPTWRDQKEGFQALNDFLHTWRESRKFQNVSNLPSYDRQDCSTASVMFLAGLNNNTVVNKEKTREGLGTSGRSPLETHVVLTRIFGGQLLMVASS